MTDMSRATRKMSWQGQPRRVSVLAEMALRQEKVSERLRELRERQGLSQEDAARKVGITHRQWQRWESGQSMPYPRSLDMVASAFGISVAEFFDPDVPVLDETQLDRIEDMLKEVLQRLRHGAEEELDPAGESVGRISAAAATGGTEDAGARARAGSGGSSGGKKAAPRRSRAPRTRKAG